jgi:hypothetical protein
MRVAPTGVVIWLLLLADSAYAQSLFILQGDHAAEGAVGWSVGSFSNGIELHGALSIDGRWDIGFGFNRYVADFGGADDTVLNEWSPFLRYFLFKEDDDGTPVSFAAHAAVFLDDYEGEGDGWYVLGGGQLFKKLAMSDGFSLYPFVGFSLAAESFSSGGSESESAVYLTRQFGVHGQIALGSNAWLRVTAEEHSFRRETFRAVRLAYLRRF